MHGDEQQRLPSDGAPPALGLLAEFELRILPRALDRLGAWKGIALPRRRQLLPDLRQELVLDALEHGDCIARLSPRERHGRWFRVLERALYRLTVRDRRRIEERHHPDTFVTAPALPAAAVELQGTLPEEDRDLLGRLLLGADRLQNGRCNIAATAARLGVHQRRVREVWSAVAERLGYGDDFLRFWQRRLAEAALGLAADLLRATGRLRLWDEDRWPPPDPKGRRRRIHRIRAHLGVRPLPEPLRLHLRSASRQSRRGADGVLPLLELAAALAPTDPAVPLWRFEACLVAGDLAGAAAALRAARRLAAPPASVLLARARLLEVRGRAGPAARLLGRGLHQHRGESCLAAGWRAVRADGPQPPASAAASASASWRSSPRSERLPE